LRDGVRKLLFGLAAEVVIIALIALLVWAAMGYVNRKLGVEPTERTEDLDLHGNGEDGFDADSVEVPVFPADSLESADEPQGVELTWETTPCSLFVDSQSAPVCDTIPESPDRTGVPLELQLVVAAWAEHAGLSGSELEEVWAFSRHDTVFADLPRRLDAQALARTLEGRFVCFTRLFPLVGGIQWDRYPEGIRMRGVADGVR